MHIHHLIPLTTLHVVREFTSKFSLYAIYIWGVAYLCCRWHYSAVSVLPEYLRKFYLRLLQNFQDFEDELQPNERYRVAYIREAVRTD